MKKLIVLTVTLVFSVSLLLMGGDTRSIEKKYKLRVRVDKKRGVTSYMPKGMSARSRIFIYIVKPDNRDDYFLRLRIAYFASERMDIKRYVFETGDEEHEILVRGPVRQQDMQNPNLPGSNPVATGGGIVEYYDIDMNPAEIEVIKKIAATKGVKMTYEGTKGNKKFKVHKGEVKDIKLVLDAYEAFKQK